MGAKNGLGNFHDEIVDARQPTVEERDAALRYLTRAGALDVLEYLFPERTLGEMAGGDVPGDG